MMAKVIKLTDNSAVTLLPITDSAYVQHKWKEGETGGTTITTVRDALNNVVHKNDLTSYVNGLNNSTGTGVVTGARLDTNGGGQKLTLSYSNNGSNFSNDSGLKTVTNVIQNTYGKITTLLFGDISTMTPATENAAGTKGFVPDPPRGSQNMVLTGDATFKAISAFQDAHATGLLYKTMNTAEEFTLFDDTKFTGSPVSLATIASPAITVSLKGLVFYGEVVDASQAVPTISLNGTTNTPTLDSATNMFYLDSWSNAAPTSMSFDNKSNIKSITKLKGLDTSNVTDMNSMFYNCSSLTSLDLSNFNTSSVTDMQYMFDSCSSLTSLDLSNWDTSNVINMDDMFSSCSALTSLDLSNFNTSKVTYMANMFNNCTSITSLDLSSFNTSNVTDMNSMFYNCSSLTSLDLSSFNTSNVTDMQYMFYSCSSLKSLDLSSFNTSNVINMDDMFSSCSALKDVYITVQSTLMKLTNNLTSQGDNYIPSSATIHYNGVDYKWQNNAWEPQS